MTKKYKRKTFLSVMRETVVYNFFYKHIRFHRPCYMYFACNLSLVLAFILPLFQLWKIEFLPSIHFTSFYYFIYFILFYSNFLNITVLFVSFFFACSIIIILKGSYNHNILLTHFHNGIVSLFSSFY